MAKRQKKVLSAISIITTIIIIVIAISVINSEFSKQEIGDSEARFSPTGAVSTTAECTDGVDNDGDTLIDNDDFGCNTGGGAEKLSSIPGLNTKINGWTYVEPSSDSRIIYVSTSGDDKNTGLTPNDPVKTPSIGTGKIRNGYPDWLLFKRGDVWDGTGIGIQFGITKSGRSISEPIVIASYGSSNQRPKFIDGKLGVTVNPQHVGIFDLEFQGSATGKMGTAIAMIASGENIFIEDIKISGYRDNVNIQATPAGSIKDLTIRRSIIIDACAANGAHSSGIFISGIDRTSTTTSDGFTFEENVMSRNGWNPSITGCDPTIFNHNLYGSYNLFANLKENIFALGSSHGSSTGPGEVYNNLYLKGSVGLYTTGYNTAWGNVFLDTKDIGTAPRGWAIWTSQNARTAYNIMAHSGLGRQPNAIEIDSAGQLQAQLAASGTTITAEVDHNVVYDWAHPTGGLGAKALYFPHSSYVQTLIHDNIFNQPKGQVVFVADAALPGSILGFKNNQYYSPDPKPFRIGATTMDFATWQKNSGETGAVFSQGTFTDPNRDITTYMTSIGDTPTLDAFLARAEQNNKFDGWDGKYTAKAVNDYIRAGFDMQLPSSISIGNQPIPISPLKTRPNAEYFDGKRDYMIMDDAPELDMGTGSFTVAFWANSEVASSYERGPNKLDATNGAGFALSVMPKGADMYLGDSAKNKASYSTQYPIGANRNTWKHLAMAVDKSTQKAILYIDGKQAGQMNIASVGSVDNNEPLALGIVPSQYKNAPQYIFGGYLDGVKLYNKALTATEIADLAADKTVPGEVTLTFTRPASLPGKTQQTTPACTSFTYTAWSACNNNLQTRTITSRTPAGCVGGNPVLSQICSTTQTTHTITITQNSGGTITPGTASVVEGASQTFAITPDPGYSITSVMIDGVDKGAITTYTFNNVMASHTISAQFVIGVPIGKIPICGDGTKDSGEECDDGNAVSGDGCSKKCITEAGTNLGTTSNLANHLLSLHKNNKQLLSFKQAINFQQRRQSITPTQLQTEVTSAVTITPTSVTVDSTTIPELNAPATIIFTDTTIKKPVIKKDGVVCTECTATQNPDGTWSVEVPGF